MDNLDDMLGPQKKSDSLDDLLGPPAKKRKSRPANNAGRHQKLAKPRTPLADGIFALRAKAEKAGTLGKTCLVGCGAKLKKSRNGQRVICEKYKCFRAYRNAYRAEYDRASA